MARFTEHLAAGIFLILVLVLSGAISINTVNILASLFFVVGSILPDIDHPSSIPRKSLRQLLFIFALFFGAFLFLEHSSNIYLALVFFVIPFLAVFILDSTIPAHRKFFHTLNAAFLFSIAIFFLSLTKLPFVGSLLLASCGFAGYVLHLILDFIWDRFRM